MMKMLGWAGTHSCPLQATLKHSHVGFPTLGPLSAILCALSYSRPSLGHSYPPSAPPKPSGPSTITTQVLGDVATGRIKVLFVSPERLNNPHLLEALRPRMPLPLVVVDEAHCVAGGALGVVRWWWSVCLCRVRCVYWCFLTPTGILPSVLPLRSLLFLPPACPPACFRPCTPIPCALQRTPEWGHSFRPAYFRLGAALAGEVRAQRILALTATATRATEEAICQVGGRAGVEGCSMCCSGSMCEWGSGVACSWQQRP